MHNGKRESPWTSKDSGRSLNPLSTVVGVSNGAMFAQRRGPSKHKMRTKCQCASRLRLHSHHDFYTLDLVAVFLPVSFTKKAASSMRRPLKSCSNFLVSVSGPQSKRRFVFTFAEWLMADTSSFKRLHYHKYDRIRCRCARL